MPWSTARLTGPKPREARFQSVDRAVDRFMPRLTGRSTDILLCTLCTPVDCPIDRFLLRSTGRSTEVILGLLPCRFSLPLSSDLCAIFRCLRYLLSPYNTRAQDNNLSEESTNQAETDAAEDVPNTTRTENNREKQSIQNLTRFDNVPTSSGQERSY